MSAPFVWPRCPHCSQRVDVRQVGTRLVASCCGREGEVALGYVPVPLNEEPVLPLPNKRKSRAA